MIKKMIFTLTLMLVTGICSAQTNYIIGLTTGVPIGASGLLGASHKMLLDASTEEVKSSSTVPQTEKVEYEENISNPNDTHEIKVFMTMALIFGIVLSFVMVVFLFKLLD